ncbi:hypothetical protein NF700_06625 [Sphingomonadaceae bacterium OTU29MARTA1]|nr:hypothetical protein NF700_06625 [Sphingomonadaceae bacterium OTU29MARTA1]
MAMLVQHILRHPSGRVSFRRQYPPELRPFISRAGGVGPIELKVSLGHEGSPGFLSRYETALMQWETTVAEARKRQAGEYDRLDPPTIAYLAKLFEVRWLDKDERDRWEKGEVHSHRVQAGLEWELDDFKRWRAEGDAEAIEERWTTAALGLLQERNLVLAPNDLDGLSQLCRALNDSAIDIASAL